MLGDCAHILRAIGEALQDRGERLRRGARGGARAGRRAGLAAAPREKPAAKEKPIDDEWVDEPVIFGPAGAPGAAPRGPQAAVMQYMPRPSMTR